MRYFLSTLILFFSCTPLPEDILGCMNFDACNFNPDANEDDGSCIPTPDMCGTCDNDSTNNCIEDCTGAFCIAGESGCLIGTGVTEDDGNQIGKDECGVCGGSGPSENYDCEGNCISEIDCIDCADVPNGPNLVDECGTCDNDPSNDCTIDCNIEWGGIAFIDDCDICVSGTTGLDACVHGCTESGYCNYDSDANVDDGSCTNEIDCQGICAGAAYVDPCGYCDADPDNDCQAECSEILAELSIDDNEFPCDGGYTEAGYYCSDLEVLRDIIINNPGSIYIWMDADSNNIISALEYGDQLWIDGRLVNLDLSYDENVITSDCEFKLDAIPAIIGELDALKTLNFKNNKISTLPEEISDLDNLEKLILESNRFTTLPGSIGNLHKLKVLYAHNNLITFLPDSFTELENLEILWLQDNNLTTLPNNIGSLSNLETLWLDNNQLTSIPVSIGQLQALKYLSLDYNLLGSLPDEICYLGIDEDGGLTINLTITNNLTCPEYPACVDIILGYQECDVCFSGYLIGDGSAGEYGMDSECLNYGDWQVLLDIIDNNDVYAGKKPIEIVHNSHWERSAEDNRLFELILNSEELNGQIPLSIGNLDSLEILHMNGNQLTGNIPGTIGYLTDLKEIKLNSNNLTGNIPLNITNLKNLLLLRLDGNNLSGDIPLDIGELEKLEEIQLQYNTLTGSIPESIGDLSNLKRLYLRDNKLSGEIPTSIGGLISLERLKLINNDLSGQIPESICNIYDINENLRLYLDNNQLCPGQSGYPECIPEFHIGSQECSD